MQNINWSKYTFFSLVTIALLIPLFNYPHLPNRVAMHFNIHGQADRYADKTELIMFDYGLIILFAGIFYASGFILKKIPNSIINLPNKDYWLHDSRRAETIKKIRDMINWVGNSILVLFIFISILSKNANINGTFKVGFIIWIIIFSFVGFNIFISIKYILYFKKKTQ